MKTLGKKISDYRKEKGLTQEELAEKVNVSSQAVSKWENDLSIPDLPILISLADLFGVTLDELVRQEEQLPAVRLLPENQKKPMEQMILKIIVDVGDDDDVHVRLNLPLMLVKACLEGDMKIPGLDIEMEENIGGMNIDWGQILMMADKGVIGKLLEVDADNDLHVEIYVE